MKDRTRERCASISLCEGVELIPALNAEIAARPWSRVVVLLDENTLEHCWPLVENADWPAGTEKLEVPSGEDYKSVGTCEGLWDAFLQLGGLLRVAVQQGVYPFDGAGA